MYTFTFGDKQIDVSGTGRFWRDLAGEDFEGLIPLESVIPMRTGEKMLSFVPVASPPTNAVFWAHIDDIDHGLGPGATVQDVIDWLFTSTTPMPVGPTSNSIAFGDGVATDFTLTHGLNAPVVLWEVRFTAAPQEYPTFSRQRIDNNTVRVFGFLVPPTLNQFTADFVKG